MTFVQGEQEARQRWAMGFRNNPARIFVDSNLLSLPGLENREMTGVTLRGFFGVDLDVKVNGINLQVTNTADFK